MHHNVETHTSDALLRSGTQSKSQPESRNPTACCGQSRSRWGQKWGQSGRTRAEVPAPSIQESSVAGPQGQGQAQAQAQAQNAKPITMAKLPEEMATTQLQAAGNVGNHIQDQIIRIGANLGNVGGTGCSYKTFTSCKPPEFQGFSDPIATMRWIKEMEVTFVTSKCAKEDKVNYATSMLKSEALFWWELEKDSRIPDTAVNTWQDFKRLLIAKFFPKDEVKQLE
ncbi:LOW QUALITY PROTEIN: hypothetical protein OSB04_031658 [Centaurea solstitialis]|uniref:Retrotransposon gag domain-containing protein n=1 Tax=Centaurea solstitialis TaxID=347529 RepID=A0AA38W4Y6_9ASTR|nr:LOW QUALITY PROTEIN: hypothetical protein OSB04_031658 [Centaurea solstitialis]